LTFLDPIPWRALCEEYLNAKELKQFKDAVEDDYFFEFLIDDLPLWGYIGEVSRSATVAVANLHHHTFVLFVFHSLLTYIYV